MVKNLAEQVNREVRNSVAKVREALKNAENYVSVDKLTGGDRAYVRLQLERAADEAAALAKKFVTDTDEIRLALQEQWESEEVPQAEEVDNDR